jgi:hypothetical protein
MGGQKQSRRHKGPLKNGSRDWNGEYSRLEVDWKVDM